MEDDAASVPALELRRHGLAEGNGRDDRAILVVLDETSAALAAICFGAIGQGDQKIAEIDEDVPVRSVVDRRHPIAPRGRTPQTAEIVGEFVRRIVYDAGHRGGVTFWTDGFGPPSELVGAARSFIVENWSFSFVTSRITEELDGRASMPLRPVTKCPVGVKESDRVISVANRRAVRQPEVLVSDRSILL